MKYITKDILDVDDFLNLEKIKKPHDNHIHVKTVYNFKNELKISYINYIFSLRSIG